MQNQKNVIKEALSFSKEIKLKREQIRLKQYKLAMW